jgi:hypothetical protein
MNVIFPSLLGTHQIDPFWAKEAEAAKSVGFGISLVSDPNEAGPMFLANKADNYLYRGWIVKPDYYKEMCQVAGAPLLNNYEDYMKSYHFPEWFAKFDDDAHETPASIIFPAHDVAKLGIREVAQRVSAYGKKPLILKDYLKSRKHEWFDACFIKDASDIDECVRVMANFFTLQGRDFYGGLVFREFLQLKKLGTHPKSGMPLPVEFRTFFLNQKPIITSLYWNNDIPYPDDVETPPQDWLEEIGKKLISPLVALDIAPSEDGKWWVIEVNDGGSAGYPDNVDSKEFYGLLYKNLTGKIS